MRRETKGVTETLLETAKKEFLKCGFRGQASEGYRLTAE